MCGIVGLFFKDKNGSKKLGRYLSEMLTIMGERGPDSAGFAIYGGEVSKLVKFCLFKEKHEEDFSWKNILSELEENLSGKFSSVSRSGIEVVSTDVDEDKVIDYLFKHHPDISVFSSGRVMEIYKAAGLPKAVSERFALSSFSGTHALGHTRMATESAVTTDHSHPFSTGNDLCLVHNGSLSNHNYYRSWLRSKGIRIRTDNDSEVASGYISYCLRSGNSLKSALSSALDVLDGFYTFAVASRSGFAVLRDRFSCKPAVLAETSEWVAMASEYRAIAHLPGASKSRIWEPYPGEVYSWEH